jgi:hypothetical protein
MSDVAAPLSASDQRTMLDAAGVWWLFLITGTAWGRGRLRAQGDPAGRVGRGGGLDSRDL